MQVGALQEYYRDLAEINANEQLLARCNFFGHYVIPTFALLFVLTYWVAGLLKYNYPEGEFVDDLRHLEILPKFQVYINLISLTSISLYKDNATITDIARTITSHIGHLFSSNSTVGQAAVETWDNITSLVKNKSWSQIARETFQTINNTWQEEIIEKI